MKPGEKGIVMSGERGCEARREGVVKPGEREGGVKPGERGVLSQEREVCEARREGL